MCQMASLVDYCRAICCNTLYIGLHLLFTISTFYISTSNIGSTNMRYCYII